MTNYDLLYIAAGVVVLMSIVIYRMATIIKPGYVGLVFMRGQYRTGLDPGFAMVAINATLQKVKVAEGPNHALGKLGVAESEISTDASGSSIRVDGIQLAARAVSPIGRGVTVRVIKDELPGEVLVAEEHAHPGGPRLPAAMSR
jgi:membrane-bound ClpP family serine protease